MNPFEPLEVPLSGTHLVEAGAGTGKTWGLTALYLRLVAEGRRTPREIAVVTFTDAATRELHERVRDRLAALARR
ncbi:MAG TPA: UvrD-helicase domain-containing protein, partial [Xanthomonadales bacterium]|nr:UvrD-helicase domain-containing protein [Xanthomonadales bacterium]